MDSRSKWKNYKGYNIKIEVYEYASGLKLEDLIDWVNNMEKYFEWSNLAKEKKVKLACTKLNGMR